MRSLPPPRITRSRKWKRIRRAIFNLLTKGYISDFGVFSRNQNIRYSYTISKIEKARFSSRMKFKTNELFLTANTSIKILTTLSKVLGKLSMPGMRKELVPNKLNVSVKF
ncbi:unnamed protein product [Candida verbasci]|uniref:Uncharacterized protein n=1 Tax=Candida verbasci TaxID=1227364 RepID=A0A9W4TX38_9ASCO|nr:unnamed protein product [Candida verbasci]